MFSKKHYLCLINTEHSILIKSLVHMKNKLINLYHELMKDTITKHEKEVKATHESDQTSAAAG